MFSYKINRLYYVIGWCVPVVMTTAWAIVTANFLDSECWTGYAWTNYYWILEGPRMAIIAVIHTLSLYIYIYIYIIYIFIFRSVPVTCINISYQYIFLCHRVFITFTSIQAIDRQNMRTDKSRPIIIFHVRYISSE